MLMNDEKHYVTLNNYLRSRFGQKVFRISLNASFTCPNRDGTIGTKGCLYCSSHLSGDFAGHKDDTLKEQFDYIQKKMAQKWSNGLYIAYLQAGSNTYANCHTLSKIYSDVISLNDKTIVLSIATRPDCINEEIVDLLKTFQQKIEIWVELGFQTKFDKTKDYLNIGYHNADFEKAIKSLNNANIPVIVHIINGLPNETKEMMIETAQYLNTFNISGIKIHMLHILRNTPLGDLYLQKPFKILTKDEYIDIVAMQLRYLNERIVIHRLTGDPSKEDLIAPTWLLKKFVILNDLDKLMRKYNYYQGDLIKKEFSQ